MPTQRIMTEVPVITTDDYDDDIVIGPKPAAQEDPGETPALQEMRRWLADIDAQIEVILVRRRQVVEEINRLLNPTTRYQRPVQNEFTDSTAERVAAVLSTAAVRDPDWFADWMDLGNSGGG